VVLVGLTDALTIINWSPNKITVQVKSTVPTGARQLYVRTSANQTSGQVAFTVSPPFGCNF
jgi:hypothetical protein